MSFYSLPDDQRPRVIGKATDGKGEWSTSIEEAPLIGHYEYQLNRLQKCWLLAS